MNTDERPPFSKGENSKQPRNRREIKSSPPARLIGKGRALLPHLDSISSMTCRATANPAEAPLPAGMSPVPVETSGPGIPSMSMHPKPLLQHQPWQHLATHLHSLRAHKSKELSGSHREGFHVVGQLSQGSAKRMFADIRHRRACISYIKYPVPLK